MSSHPQFYHDFLLRSKTYLKETLFGASATFKIEFNILIIHKYHFQVNVFCYYKAIALFAYSSIDIHVGDHVHK